MWKTTLNFFPSKAAACDIAFAVAAATEAAHRTVVKVVCHHGCRGTDVLICLVNDSRTDEGRIPAVIKQEPRTSHKGKLKHIVVRAPVGLRQMCGKSGVGELCVFVRVHLWPHMFDRFMFEDDNVCTHACIYPK